MLSPEANTVHLRCLPPDASCEAVEVGHDCTKIGCLAIPILLTAPRFSVFLPPQGHRKRLAPGLFSGLPPMHRLLAKAKVLLPEFLGRLTVRRVPGRSDDRRLGNECARKCR